MLIHSHLCGGQNDRHTEETPSCFTSLTTFVCKRIVQARPVDGAEGLSVSDDGAAAHRDGSACSRLLDDQRIEHDVAPVLPQKGELGRHWEVVEGEGDSLLHLCEREVFADVNTGLSLRSGALEIDLLI